MATWTIDASHSDVHFKVKHLMINTVTGEFTSYRLNATAEADDFSDAHVVFEADVASISTKNEMRDNHLKSDDFFNAEQFPVMRFESTALRQVKGEKYALEGNLTIRDVTRPVVLDAEFGGTMVDFYGNTKAGFEITGTVNRKEFGLKWDAVTEAGGVVVSDTVRLIINAQLQKVA